VSAENDRPEPRSNPVSRSVLLARFSDGKWWTASGMADALGSDVPDDLAVRFLNKKSPGSAAGKTPAALIRHARRLCVRETLSSMTQASLLDVKSEHGTKFYRIRPGVGPRRVDRTAVLTAQTEPGGTETGLTTAGLLAALQTLGTTDLATLAEALVPAMVPVDELTKWYERSHGAAYRARAEKALGGGPAAVVAAARQAAVMTAVKRAQPTHPVTYVRSVIVSYTRPAPPPG
jgi:hypothetical protein